MWGEPNTRTEPNRTETNRNRRLSIPQESVDAFGRDMEAYRTGQRAILATFVLLVLLLGIESLPGTCRCSLEGLSQPFHASELHGLVRLHLGNPGVSCGFHLLEAHVAVEHSDDWRISDVLGQGALRSPFPAIGLSEAPLGGLQVVGAPVRALTRLTSLHSCWYKSRISG